VDFTGILGQLGAAPGRFVLGRIPKVLAAGRVVIYRPHRGFDSAFQYDREPEVEAETTPAKQAAPIWQLPPRIVECR